MKSVSPLELLRNGKVKPTAKDKRSAKYTALVASLYAPQHTSIATSPATKAKPGVGAFASI